MLAFCRKPSSNKISTLILNMLLEICLKLDSYATILTLYSILLA